MPHFQFDIEEDGKVRAIYKDGKLVEGRVQLEMSNSIVQTYFSSALRNIQQMRPDQDKTESRHYGLQGFLMGLVGLEAFVNVYFHRIALSKHDNKMLAILDDRRKPLEGKLGSLPRMAFGQALPDQKAINRKLRELYNLRSAIVHPKLEPSSLSFGNWISADMIENFQQVFQDRQFVLESLQWCMLTIARVGLAADDGYRDKFLAFWTTLADTNDSLSAALGVSPAPGELKQSLLSHSASNP
jgi:hypothetical protein